MPEAAVHTNGKVHVAEPKYSLVKLDAEGVRKLWHRYILPGLLEIKRKDKASGFWIPEHVRSLIERGFIGQPFCECHIIVPLNSGEPVGFIVLRLYNDEFVQVPTSLFVWLTYCVDPRAKRHIVPLVEKRAREIGVRWVDGITSRLSWARALKSQGYSIHQVIIRKEVS